MRARLFEQSGDVIRSGWRLSEEKGYQQAARPGPTPGGCVGGWGLMIWMNHPAVIKETLNSPLWETDKFDSTVHQFSVLIPEVSVLPPGVHQSFLIILIFFPTSVQSLSLKSTQQRALITIEPWVTSIGTVSMQQHRAGSALPLTDLALIHLSR